MNNKKYIFRQIGKESAELAYYFDTDGFSEAAGDYCYNLFIVYNSSRSGGKESYINADEYNKIVKDVNLLLDDFSDVVGGCIDCNGKPLTHKSVMIDHGISYSSQKCKRMKEWAKNADAASSEDIAAYLSFKTDRSWTTTSARGYCQGDYCEVIYCEDFYKEINAQAAGEVFLGAANEYCFIDLSTAEDEEEADHVYGYIVADCQARKDEDIKKILCSLEGINPEETDLQLIDDCKIVYRHEYSYRTA